MCSVYCPSGILFVAAIFSPSVCCCPRNMGGAWWRARSVYARNLNNYFCSIPQHALSFPYGGLLTLGHSELRDVTALISLVKKIYPSIWNEPFLQSSSFNLTVQVCPLNMMTHWTPAESRDSKTRCGRWWPGLRGKMQILRVRNRTLNTAVFPLLHSVLYGGWRPRLADGYHCIVYKYIADLDVNKQTKETIKIKSFFSPLHGLLAIHCLWGSCSFVHFSSADYSFLYCPQRSIIFKWHLNFFVGENQ